MLDQEPLTPIQGSHAGPVKSFSLTPLQLTTKATMNYDVEMNNDPNRLYLYGISRKDLPIHQQAIQAAHAQFEYLRANHSSIKEHPNFVWLAVEDKRELLNLTASLKAFDVKVLAWSDDDYEGYEVSAISCLLVDSERHLLRDIELWNCGQFSEPAVETPAEGKFIEVGVD